MYTSRISKQTIKRLAIYYRCLEKLHKEGIRTVSSHQIGEELGLKASQVRKDLSYFGGFGKRGVGYEIRTLASRISKILGMTRSWKTCIVGFGNLGNALLHFPGIRDKGFDIVGVFDKDQTKIGSAVDDLLKVEDVASISTTIRTRGIEIGVIATPAEDAQRVADLLIECGVKGIVSFAPTKLNVPERISVEEIDISVALSSVAFGIIRMERDGD